MLGGDVGVSSGCDRVDSVELDREVGIDVDAGAVERQIEFIEAHALCCGGVVIVERVTDGHYCSGDCGVVCDEALGSQRDD